MLLITVYKVGFVICFVLQVVFAMFVKPPDNSIEDYIIKYFLTVILALFLACTWPVIVVAAIFQAFVRK